MPSSDLYTDEPRPRLCHLRRWPNYAGYGFNLHCDKSKPGQYIGKVDENSPAESAGLRENDRIVEVNYVPIGSENHKQVVARIKEGVSRNNTKYPEEVILLVLDPEADDYYRRKSIIVRSDDPNVEKRETEIRNGNESSDVSPQLSNRSIGKYESPAKYHESNGNYKHVTDFTGPTVTQTKVKEHDDHAERGVLHQIAIIRPSPTPSRQTSSPNDGKMSNASTSGSSEASPPSHNVAATLEFKMSAAEYREKLKAQSARKRDPRQEQTLSMKQKHALIDQL